MSAELPPHTVRISPKARHARLRVIPGRGLEVVLPRGVNPACVPGLLERHRVWITRALVRMENTMPHVSSDVLPERVALHGGRVMLPVVWNTRGSGEGVLACGCAPTDPRATKALQAAVSAYAKRYLAGQLAALATEFGFRYSAVTVRRLRSRWGSCTRDGRISLNLCLVFLPDVLCRHILLHELAHTKQCDHSQAYWKVLFAVEPDALVHDKALRGAWKYVPQWVWG